MILSAFREDEVEILDPGHNLHPGGAPAVCGHESQSGDMDHQQLCAAMCNWNWHQFEVVIRPLFKMSRVKNQPYILGQNLALNKTMLAGHHFLRIFVLNLESPVILSRTV